MKHITDLNEITNELTLVDFYATWCGPCRMLGPIVEQIDLVPAVKVDVDKAEDLAIKFRIQAVPTLVLLKNKEEVARRSGYDTLENINAWINQFK